MCRRIHKWLAIGVHRKIINWILEGVPLFLSSQPEWCELPNHVFSNKQAVFVDAEVCELLTADSIRVIPHEKANCVLPISVVAKKGGKLNLDWYWIHDTPTHAFPAHRSNRKVWTLSQSSFNLETS